MLISEFVKNDFFSFQGNPVGVGVAAATSARARRVCDGSIDEHYRLHQRYRVPGQQDGRQLFDGECELSVTPLTNTLYTLLLSWLLKLLVVHKPDTSLPDTHSLPLFQPRVGDSRKSSQRNFSENKNQVDDASDSESAYRRQSESDPVARAARQLARRGRSREGNHMKKRGRLDKPGFIQSISWDR